MEKEFYPKVLILAMGRINKTDTANNGLLLRNLFSDFPLSATAQIYSGGGNDDEGFFGSYYCLNKKDRFLGSLFFRLKSEANIQNEHELNYSYSNNKLIIPNFIKRLGKKILMDSGLYELIFRPRLSKAMVKFVESFNPDIVFAQGYYLTFAWLPCMISERFKVPIAYYPTDDWSESRYRKESGNTSIFSYFMRYIVRKSAFDLVQNSKLCIAFNNQMKSAFLKRFNKNFEVLMQGDNKDRFENVKPVRNASNGNTLIVSTGDFDSHRLPLLQDLETACEILNNEGLKVHVFVYPVNKIPEFVFKHITIGETPSHESLVSFLKGADILFLPERFDSSVDFIKYSISSKAHLFMFSEKPIIVYSHSLSGISNYAKEEKWALSLDVRDSSLLAKNITELIKNRDLQKCLKDSCKIVSAKNHHLPKIKSDFLEMLKLLISQK
jgi:hypothetical protein